MISKHAFNCKIKSLNVNSFEYYSLAETKLLPPVHQPSVGYMKKKNLYCQYVCKSMEVREESMEVQQETVQYLVHRLNKLGPVSYKKAQKKAEADNLAFSFCTSILSSSNSIILLIF